MSYDHKEFVQSEIKSTLSERFEKSPCGQFWIRKPDVTEKKSSVEVKLKAFSVSAFLKTIFRGNR